VRRVGIRIAALSAAGLVLATTVVGAGSAAAALAPGYTASFVPLTSVVVPLSSAVNPVTDTLYYAGAHSTGGGPEGSEFELAVVDGSSDAIEATLTLAGAPNGTAVNSATNTVYVSDGSQIAVIDGATNSVSATIPLPAGTTAQGIAVDSTTNAIYVANGSSSNGGVIVIDGNTDTVTTTFSSGGEEPDSVAVDESTGVLWAADYSGQVVEISEATGSVIGTISPSADPEDVAVNPVTDTVYVSTNATSNTLTVIDGATGAITTTVPVEGDGGALAVDPSADAIYLFGEAVIGGVTSIGLIVIDGATNAPVNAIGVSADDPAVDPATGAIYTGSDDFQAFPGLWAITPSATNGISPLISGPSPDPTATTATVGIPFAAEFYIDAGQPVPNFTETGPLPPGVTMDDSGGLSGTPAQGSAGVYPITVTASNGIAPDYSIPFTLTVVDVPTITSADQAVFFTGEVHDFTVTAVGISSPTFTESGALPAGVSLSSSGVLSGTPAAGSAARYPVTITATGSEGTTTQAFTILVDVPGAPPAAGGVLGDVTGNGLDDILAIDPAGNLWLYPSTGSGDASMFAGGRSKVGSGWTGYTLAAVAPLYGAAEAGILAIAPGGNLWYYPNTGGTGTGTFGGRSLTGTGWAGYTVVGVTDLYGTGQPGILAIDPSGNLWYYPATGGTGTSTFGARSQVGSGWTGWTADIAGGTSPSLVGVDSNGNMWLYSNTGGAGTSTFGTPTQISNAWLGYQAIDLGTLTTGSGGAGILGIDAAGNLWYYPSTGSGTYGTPIQVGTGWTGYRIN
jgi:DNA-binding beta-propeller fold protein YncE